MSDRAPPEPLRVIRHQTVLFASAAVLGLGVLALPRAVLPLLALLCGFGSAIAVAHFAQSVQTRARRATGDRATVSRGRITEQVDGDQVTFHLPGEGLEPWAVDAWVLTVATLGTWALAVVTTRAAVFAFLAILIAVIAGRMRASRDDRIHLQVETTRFLVESSEGGRRSRRTVRGPLLPELASDSLTLWSSSGRIGVLRGELLPAERAWLAERLAALAERASLATGELDQSMDSEQPQHDREREQRDHAD